MENYWIVNEDNSTGIPGHLRVMADHWSPYGKAQVEPARIEELRAWKAILVYPRGGSPT